MNRLIKNELIKIFKKKTIYITMGLVFLLVIFMNCMIKISSNSYSYAYMYSESYINSLKDEIADLNPENPSDVTLYINLKSEIELNELMNKYKDSEWKISIINERIYPFISEKNTYMYGEGKDENLVIQTNHKIDELISKIDNNDWEYFAQEDLKSANNTIKDLNTKKEQTVDSEILRNINNEIENAKIDKDIATWRLEKKIPYGSDYLNKAILEYKSSASTIIEYDSKNEELEYEEQKQYNKALENREKSKYIIETGIDVNKTDSLKYILQNFYSQFGIFLIVVIIMIAGTIVSEEFNKGTIKLLLVKPYTRNKILAAKFITTLIIIAFVAVTTIIMQILVGGIFFGFDSLNLPVIAYNFNTNTLQKINIFVYLGLQTIANLPLIILLATLAFAISTIFSNSALAITVSLLGYMTSTVINQLIMGYNITFMKYFVTMNWDFSQYLFGSLPYMQGMSMLISLITCIIYLLLMLIPTFIIFKRRNIKNI